MYANKINLNDYKITSDDYQLNETLSNYVFYYTGYSYVSYNTSPIIHLFDNFDIISIHEKCMADNYRMLSIQSIIKDYRPTIIKYLLSIGKNFKNTYIKINNIDFTILKDYNIINSISIDYGTNTKTTSCLIFNTMDDFSTYDSQYHPFLEYVVNRINSADTYETIDQITNESMSYLTRFSKAKSGLVKLNPV